MFAEIHSWIQNESIKELSSRELSASFFLINHTIYQSCLSSLFVVIQQFPSIQLVQNWWAGKSPSWTFKMISMLQKNYCHWRAKRVGIGGVEITQQHAPKNVRNMGIILFPLLNLPRYSSVWYYLETTKAKGKEIFLKHDKGGYF